MSDITPTDLERAMFFANRALDVPYADPDDDLRTVSRQFLRLLEQIAKQPAEPQGDAQVKLTAFAVHQAINSEACENAPELFGKCESCNIIATALRAAEQRATRAARLEEAKCIYTNWNVHDRDFELWLENHVRALIAEAEKGAAP
jgi:hypothetical protein